MELEATREIRNRRLARQPCRHHGGMAANDDQHRRARLRARRWPELRAAENQQPEGTARRLRQRIWRGARGACQGERCGNAEELEAARRRQGDSQHASRDLHPRHGVEPPDSSPRAAHGLLPPDWCSRAGPLWSERRRSPTGCGGSRYKLNYIRDPGAGNSALKILPATAAGRGSLSEQRVIRPCGRVHLLRAAARSAAGVLQSLIESVQLVAEVAESDFFRPQLLLSLYFSRLPLLFFIF